MASIVYACGRNSLQVLDNGKMKLSRKAVLLENGAVEEEHEKPEEGKIYRQDDT
jgi:hypothetical protein